MNSGALKPFDPAFYLTKDIIGLAQKLLGQRLITTIAGQQCSATIVETEAYKAPDDKGSHAYLNKRTKRTEVMFGPGGHSYIYLCYGLHQMFNVVSGPVDTAHAILIRAVEPVTGLQHMTKRRKNTQGVRLTNGPGKLCQALGINKALNGIDLTNIHSPIWIAQDKHIAQEDITASPRVGIAYAQECALYPWRFRIKANAYTSLPHTVHYDF